MAKTSIRGNPYVLEGPEELPVHIVDPFPQTTMTRHSGSVYLAGPITGNSYEEARFGWRKYVADHLEPGIKVLSPMRHEGHLSEIQKLEKDYPDHFFSKAKMIFNKDVLDIEMADMVLVNLAGANRVSIGSMVEIGIAYAKGKKIVVVMEDGNMHDHPFVSEPSMIVTSNLDEAIMIINSLLSEGI